MKFRVAILLCVATSAPVFAQTGGLTPAWDFRKTLESLTQQTQRLPALLDRVRAQDWTLKGAPAAYFEQSQQLRTQAGFLAQDAKSLAADPSKMPITLTVFLRLQSLEIVLLSIEDGVRRYQDPALANELQTVIDDNTANRERLREYLVELVSSKEAELSIMDKEAQRCRTLLFQAPPARTPVRPKQ